MVDPAGAVHVDKLLEDYRRLDAPGAAVLVVRDGRTEFVRTCGCADLEQGTPVDPATNFRLASITKQFTAACVMMLVERGELSLDATLPELFADFPAFGGAVTLRDLLQHTSGLVDYESLIVRELTGQVSDRDVLRMVRESGRVYFTPGAHFRYSNTGYALLAVLVEETSGRRFAEFLEAQIFAPLAMTATVAYEAGLSEVRNRALGYDVRDDGTVVPSDQDATSAVLGDGGIYTSLVDYGKWDRALYTEALLSRASLEMMWAPGPGHYGFGWRVDEFAGCRRLHHEGFSCGFRNHVMRFPDERLTILILTNRREPNVLPIAESIARYCLR